MSFGHEECCKFWRSDQFGASLEQVSFWGRKPLAPKEREPAPVSMPQTNLHHRVPFSTQKINAMKRKSREWKNYQKILRRERRQWRKGGAERRSPCIPKMTTKEPFTSNNLNFTSDFVFSRLRLGLQHFWPRLKKYKTV